MNLLRMCTLASGSSGNCTLVSDGRTHLLIDAGISARRICRSLRDLGVEPSALSAVLVTHEHTDHICGLTTLTKQLGLPVYASGGTGQQLRAKGTLPEALLRSFRTGDRFTVDGLEISTFPTLHDTPESTGYAVSDGVHKAAVVTDLGRVTEAVRAGVSGADLLVCESNHDVDWVQSGPYPYFLKARILGDRGHLSNEAGASLALEAVGWGARAILLAHRSSENNTPARAYDTVSAVLERHGALPGRDVCLEVAPRSEPGRMLTVG